MKTKSFKLGKLTIKHNNSLVDVGNEVLYNHPILNLPIESKIKVQSVFLPKFDSFISTGLKKVLTN